MLKKFGPKNREEEEIFAVESLIFDVQYEIQREMKSRGLSQKDLAVRLGCSQARVSQLLSDKGANMTLETIGRVFFALEAKCSFASALLAERSAKRQSTDRSTITAKQFKHVQRADYSWAFGRSESASRSHQHETDVLAQFVALLPKQHFVELANENVALRRTKKSKAAA